jgi:surface polysaccharide O-acyltransferase-like enzyme
MGFFFLISGYFLDASIERHGAANVIWTRLIRLGIPLIIFVVFVNGLIGWAINGGDMGYVEFVAGPYLSGGNAEFGPLWFTAHLLIYIVVYAALRNVLAPSLGSPDAPGHMAILVYAILLGAVTALVRFYSPIDDWGRVFGLIPVEFARLPQHLSLFVIGIIAGRGRWFEKLDDSVAAIWFALGAAIFLVMAILETPRLAVPDYVGLRVLWGFLEAFVGVGMILGLTAFFRRFLSGPGGWGDRLAGNVYGVYLIHVYFVIALQMAVLNSGWPALIKFAAVAAASIVISFILVFLLRLIPGARRIL